MPSPIVLFVYNRLHHAQRAVEALRRNDLAGESELLVYSDGAGNDADRTQVEKVRAYLNTVRGFKSVRIIEREKNFGLAGSVIGGLTEVFESYEEAIVLEDDLVTSPFFLRFMNEAL